MNPEAYHKALEDLVVQHPVAMSTIVQLGGPLPDGEDDEHRAQIYDLVRGAVEELSREWQEPPTGPGRTEGGGYS